MKRENIQTVNYFLDDALCNKGVNSMEQKKITLNDERQLYVIPCEDGYTTHGYQVVFNTALKIFEYLQKKSCKVGAKPPHSGEYFFDASGYNLDRAKIGTLEMYETYKNLCVAAFAYYNVTKLRLDFDLIPEFKGHEGKMVSVVDRHGDHRVFKIGKSSGYIPCHLEIEPDQIGGMPIMGYPFKSMIIIER